jgi:hypothetical protein
MPIGGRVTLWRIFLGVRKIGHGFALIFGVRNVTEGMEWVLKIAHAFAMGLEQRVKFLCVVGVFANNKFHEICVKKRDSLLRKYEGRVVGEDANNGSNNAL